MPALKTSAQLSEFQLRLKIVLQSMSEFDAVNFTCQSKFESPDQYFAASDELIEA